MVGSGKGAENGILIRSGAAIQRMSEVTTVVLDKTGTLTAGHPEVMQVELLEGKNETELIRMAASVEKNSIHPLAKAIVRFAQGKQIGLNDVTDVFSTPGKGMEAVLGGSKIKVGDREYVGYQGDFDAHGSHVFMAVNDTVYGVFVLQDQIRADSNSLVQYLNNKQYKIVMLTGDKANVAEVMANEIGIEKVFSEVMPSDKLKTVQSIQESGEVVCMIGDGINDAPALAQADVGIAMGTGADIAMESGDIILIRGDLSKVKKAISLSNKTFRKIRQNLFWASIYNLIAIPMAIFGVLHPILAEAIMAFSSINVVWNSTRLRHETL
jgi:Cu+-exporting ATPase